MLCPTADNQQSSILVQSAVFELVVIGLRLGSLRVPLRINALEKSKFVVCETRDVDVVEPATSVKGLHGLIRVSVCQLSSLSLYLPVSRKSTCILVPNAS